MIMIGRCLALTVWPGLVNEKLHAVEFLQQIVGKLDVRLVDLVDQEHGLGGRLERVPQLAALDVIGDVSDLLVAELRIAQTGDTASYSYSPCCARVVDLMCHSTSG